MRRRSAARFRSGLFACLCLAGAPAHSADVPEPPVNVSFAEVRALPADPPDRVESYGPSPLQRLELWFPEGAGPHPALFLVHGGCWLSAYGVDHVRPLATALRADGWLVAAPEYRRVGDVGGGWPGTFEDVGDAFEGLFAGAAAERIDPQRVALAGHSAGGHLALWLGAGTGRDRDGDADPAATPQPALILGLAAITDLERYARGTGSCESVTPRLLGGTPAEVPERYAAASPVRLPAPAVTPVLIRGTEDLIVPETQAQAYRDAVGARVVPVSGAGHFDSIHPGTAAHEALLDALSPLAPGAEHAP